MTSIANVLDAAGQLVMQRATQASATDKLRELERELKKVRALFMAEAISEAEMQRMSAEINVKRARLRDAAATTAPSGEAIAQLAEAWAAAKTIADDATRRRLQRQVIQAIIAGIVADVRARRVVTIERQPEFAGASDVSV